MGKSLFNYFPYQHPEIGKFQGVTPPSVVVLPHGPYVAATKKGYMWTAREPDAPISAAATASISRSVVSIFASSPRFFPQSPLVHSIWPSIVARTLMFVQSHGMGWEWKDLAGRWLDRMTIVIG
jgi:hypothetical protein